MPDHARRSGCNIIAPTATTWSYGPFADDGTAEVLVNFDHRVLDGLTVAVALADLETVLRGELLRELNALAASAEAA